MIESGRDMSGSLLLESRRINDASPKHVADRIDALWGSPAGKKLALLGTAYRPNSEDTRNSPTLSLAGELVRRGARVILHDPYVRPEDQNLERAAMTSSFTRDFDQALTGADGVIMCAAHEFYRKEWPQLLRRLPRNSAVFDACHLLTRAEAPDLPGLGKGKKAPSPELIAFGAESFKAAETGLALEIEAFVQFINAAYPEPGNALAFEDIQRLAGTCVTGCRLVRPDRIAALPVFLGKPLRLAERGWTLSVNREKKSG